jgi:hypothetical protein
MPEARLAKDCSNSMCINGKYSNSFLYFLTSEKKTFPFNRQKWEKRFHPRPINIEEISKFIEMEDVYEDNILFCFVFPWVVERK